MEETGGQPAADDDEHERHVRSPPVMPASEFEQPVDVEEQEGSVAGSDGSDSLVDPPVEPTGQPKPEQRAVQSPQSGKREIWPLPGAPLLLVCL